MKQIKINRGEYLSMPLNLAKVLMIGIILIVNSLSSGAANYYVSSTSPNRSDSHPGTSPDYPWATMQKVNNQTFSPGDTVRFYGTITDQLISDPGNGSQYAPIVFMGTGRPNPDNPDNERTLIRGILLSNTQHVEFINFESSSPIIQVRTNNSSKNPVKFIKFKNLYLHDGIQGVAITIPTATDITFENTIIDNMKEDGILLSDPAGDRFSYIGGSITNTGKVNPGWGTHGCYASGGTGHVFDGVTFYNNANGWSFSIRRGGITLRNCKFLNTQGSGAINNCNEDEASGINRFTGSRAKNQYYMIYRNLFVGNGMNSALYHSNNVDQGTNDPGNAWVIFNNTFVDITINFSDTKNYSRFYDIYMRNNAFINTKVRFKTPNSDKEHVLSNNGWWDSSTYTYNNITADFPGEGNITTDPFLDTENNVNAEDYKDAGTTEIAPLRLDKEMLEVSMVADETDPLYYLGMCPDIGKNEYGDGYIPNVLPVATIDEITPNPAYFGSSVSFKGTGTDADGTIITYEWKSDLCGIFSSSEQTDYAGLSAGTHTITFRVKDNRGGWSSPVSSTLVINSNPTSFIADWKFDENGGTVAADSSPNGNTGELKEGTTWVSGKIGSALNFNNSYVDVSSSTSLNTITNAITLSAWVKAGVTTSKSTIIERWLYGIGVNQRSYCLYISSSGTVLFGISKDGAVSKWITTQETVPWNTWTYITATFDGSVMKIYINGTLSTSGAAGFSTIFVPAGNVHIGYWQTNADTWEAPFIGVIDEVKVFNEALSIGEINNLYHDHNLPVDVISGTYDVKCYPNPFSSQLTVDYDLVVNGKAIIQIYNLNGQLVKEVIDNHTNSVGNHSTVLNTDDLPSGLYFCKIVINEKTQTHKILKK